MKTKLCLFIFIFILTSCSAVRDQLNPSLSVPTQQSTTTLQTESTSTFPFTPTNPVATITPLPTRVTPTTDPPYDTPADWILVSDSTLGFAMKIPNNWESLEPQSWSGMDAALHYSQHDNHAAGPNAVCLMEANTNPGIGNQPTLQLWNNNNGFYGCEIIPSEDASDPDAILLVWYPWDMDPGFILEVTLSPRYVNPIKNGFQTLASDMIMTPTVGQSSSNLPEYQVSEYAGLQFEEYRITSAEWYQKHDVEAFARLLPGEVRKRREEISNNWKQQIPSINQQLALFGIHISGCSQAECNILILEFGEVYPDQKPIPLLRLGDLVINQSGTRFFLPVYEFDTYRKYMISENGIERDDFSAFYSSLGFVSTHAFIGDDHIYLQYDQDYLAGAGYSLSLQVFRNDDLIFTYTILPPNPASGPVRGLYVYQNHWYLEVADVLIRDGVVLNDETSVSEMFTFHFLNEKPFYFYRQAENIHISYAGETLPIHYQSVIHEPMCCSGGMTNMSMAYNALGFYALRDGSWFYVLITPLNP